MGAHQEGMSHNSLKIDVFSEIDVPKFFGSGPKMSHNFRNFFISLFISMRYKEKPTCIPKTVHRGVPSSIPFAFGIRSVVPGFQACANHRGMGATSSQNQEGGHFETKV